MLMTSSDPVLPLFCRMNDNNLGKVGGVAFAKALETNTSLQMLQ